MKEQEKNYGKIGKRLSVFKEMIPLFCFLSLTGIVITIIAVFLTGGEIIPYILFKDKADTGMDFFHSIEYTRGGAPYELYNTLYPPLANAFFYLLLQFVPESQSRQWADTFREGITARQTSIDLRVNQATMLLFIIFIMLITAFLVMLIKKYVLNAKRASLLAMCLLFSHGVLFTFERGNITLVALLCCFVFLMYRNSDNILLREIALIALAVGAGLKLYPAVFGMLLIYDKQYRKAIRAVAYGITAFVLPIFLFKEGVYGFGIFFDVLFKWSGKTGLSGNGLAFSNFINSIILIETDKFPLLVLNEEVVSKFTSGLNVFVFIILIFGGFWLKKEWQRVMVCSLAIILVQTQGIPMLMFMMPVLLQMIAEERKITECTIIPFIAVALTQIILPFTRDYAELVSDYFIRYQICLFVLLVYIIMNVVKEIRCKINFKENFMSQVMVK